MYTLITSLVAANGYSLERSSEIEAMSNVQNPTWEQGFSEIQYSGSKIISGVKAYKSYTSIVKNEEYVNWVCNGMYNLRLTKNESQSGLANDAIKVFTYLDQDDGDSEARDWRAQGWVGPGPQCVLAKIKSVTGSDGNVLGTVFNNGIKTGDLMTLGTLLCNVTHTAQQFAGLTTQEHQFDTYYGFGNYCVLEPDGFGRMTGSLTVFDGDVYNLPCELVSMFKMYNFKSIIDSIPSA
uniref:Uncharacterized protein n=1 Tax=Dulem virus 42 TaxID=3145760 RepID=A0AAU8B7W2_9CAUD